VIHLPKIGLIVGSSGTGKTFAGGYLAARIARDFVVIVSTRELASVGSSQTSRETERA